jgi:hypothetical protein
MTITVVVWLWHAGFRDYCAEHVNTLARVLRRNSSIPLRFVCVADNPDGLAQWVEWFPTPEAAVEVGKLRNPCGQRFPSCYRRLWMFSEDARQLGERLFLLDIDTLALREIAHLFAFDAPFVGWRPMATWGNQQRYGGGSYLLTPGTRPQVWNDFNGQPSIDEALAAGFRGSDQAWISYKLGPDEPIWPADAGIYSIRDISNGAKPLPEDACLVHFNGPQKPWNSALPWVAAHWR